MPICTSCGRESADEFAFCPHCGAPFADEPTGARAAQGRHGALLRRDRLDRARRAARPGGAARAARPLLRADEGDRRAARRHGREVHRRRGDGRVRRAGRARGRRAACAAGGGRDAGGVPGARHPGPDRRDDRRGRHRHGGAARDRRRGQRRRAAGAGGAAGRDPDRRGDATGWRATRSRSRRSSRSRSRARPSRSPAYRLLSVHGDGGLRPPPRTRRWSGASASCGCSRRPGSRSSPSASCHLFTVLGAAGVGKSRLAAEFLGSLDDALVVRGRCLPYGEGITYWPVVEVVKQLPETPSSTRSRRRRSRPSLGERQLVTLERGDRLGVPQAARGGRGRDAARLRVRRHALGRGDVPRPGRARRRPLARRADPAALHGAAGPARPAAGLGRRQGERHQRAARAARPERDRAADREPGATSTRACASGFARRPRATRCSSRRWSRWSGSRGDGDVDRAADDPGAARGPARPARRARAQRARARRGRGPRLPPRRGAGARPGRAAGGRRA